MTEKRPRSQNFSTEEKILLLNIVSKYKHVIENKKSDSISVKQKNFTWDKIASEFNSCAVNSCFREVNVLRKFYENRKKEVRKLAAWEKSERNATGGGPPPKIKKDDTYDLILSLMNEKTVYGLNNTFSDLTDPVPNTTQEFQNEEVFEILDINDEKLEQRETRQISSVNKDLHQHNKETTHSWKEYTPTDLQNKQSAELQTEIPQKACDVNENICVEQGEKKRQITPRRRPATVVRALTSSAIAEKYDNLLDRRLRIAEIQEKSLAYDVRNKNEEHAKKMQILDLEIRLKEKQLNT